jgi:hypothetical protein
VAARKRTNAHVPTQETRAKVWMMTASGVTQMQIAKVIGISDRTLRRHYGREFNCAVTEANTNVSRSLYNKAIGNTPQAIPAAMFWLRTRAGWRETGPPEDVPALAPVININFPGPKKKDKAD